MPQRRSDPSRWHYRALLPSSAVGISGLHELFDRIRDEHGDALIATDRLGLRTAIAELFANVIEHADVDADAEIVVAVNVTADHLIGLLVAHGARVDTAAPTDLVPADAEDGRGMMLVRTLCELQYEREEGLNVWHLTRSRSPVEVPGEVATPSPTAQRSAPEVGIGS